MSRQTIFISGLPPVEVERPRGWTIPQTAFGRDPAHEEGNGYAHSEALVCPRCLTVWAILSFAESGKDHHIRPAWCQKHVPEEASWFPIIPGSIFEGLAGYHVDMPLLEVLPEFLLRREVELHLREYERRASNG